MYEINYRLFRIFDFLHGACILKGGNRFVCDAYRRASRLMAHFPEDVATIYEYEGREGLRRALKVGSAVLSKIVQMVEEGRVGEYEEALREFGRDAVEFVKVRGIGRTTARRLVEMGIRTFDDLLRSLESGRAKTIFKNPTRIRENVLFYLKYRDAFLAPEARIVVEAFKNVYPSAVPVGGYRRGEPLIAVVEFAISEDDAFRLAVSGRYERGYWSWGGDKIPVRIHIYTEEDMGSVLVYSTGPEGHVRALERLGGIRGKTEEEVYDRLGLPFIHPYQRYDGHEVSLAAEGKLPEVLLPEEVPGDIHVHTTYSDGSMRPEEAVQAAVRRGYSFVVLADHSPSSAGGGLNEARLESKKLEILRLRDRYPYVRILYGTEVDILPDGSLDYPDEVLSEFDLVIASVHTWGDNEDLTGRILKAMENPYVHVIGHPTGRVLKKRPPYRVDLDRVFRRAEETGKALEINANPRRVDLPGEFLLEGGYEGKVFIGTDAHREWDMDYMYLGCAQVGKARVPKDRVGNLDL